MEFTYFIGTDVSKNELDFTVMQGSKQLFHQEIANKPEAIMAFIKALVKQAGFDLKKTVFCMEHTGIYSNHLLSCLQKKQARICLEAASHIKSSIGNIRGKNDKIDSQRIAHYAYKNRETLRLWEPKQDVIQKLAHLSVTRSRLVESKRRLKAPLKEMRSFVCKAIVKQSLQLCNRTLNSIDADLKKTENAIDQLIAADAELKRLFGLVTSVSGVGKVTATQILITTNGFKSISDPKKFACYSGVAPFANESGVYKGKARVSHMANKKMKTLLHLAALVAIKYSPDLNAYYQRKINNEKKNKMSAINAVRNKLILRIFACVNQNRKYEKNYLKLVA